MKENATSSTPAEIRVGQATIELLSREDRFPGLGKITVNGVTIRSATVPLRPDIMTPDGIRYDSFRLDDVQTDGADVVLLTTAFGRQGLFGEYRDEYDSQLAWPRVEGGPFEDTVEWRLKPEQLTLDGVQYDGFSYALSFRSDQRSIHQITMTATWELGGSASGNTLLSQGQVNPPVYYCETDTDFTTTCWRQLSQAGNPHGVSFQFSSRYSPMQCFDFQYGPAGSLLGYWPEFVDVHSMIQKNKGEDVVFVLDKCLKPLGQDLTFPRKCILLAPPPPEGAQEHLMHDRWLRALQHAQGVVRAAFDVNTPYLLPECGLAYRPELDDDGKLLIYIAGKPYAPENALAGWAEHLPALAAAGVRRVFPEPMGESDISENGYTYKLQSGIHGDLVTSSTCNCWRYRMAEFWGGWEAWEAFYAAGKAAGLEVGQWVGGQLSPNAPIFKEHPEFVCRAVNTRPHSGGPIINVTWGLNWNTACDWLLESFAEWKRHGLDYVFFDSIGNFAMMGVDYQAGMQPNAAGVARFIGGLNKMGVKAISNEGIGPMGFGRFGMGDNVTDNPAATHAVAGQNDWSWWVGHEDMLIGTLPMVHIHPSRTEQQVKEQCFRALANYSLLMLGEHEDDIVDQWPSNLDEMTSYYHTFNQVKSLMETRRLLPDDHGVEWQAAAGRALFAYAAFDYELPDSARVERISGESATPEDARGTLRTEPYTIYRITGAPSSV